MRSLTQIALVLLCVAQLSSISFAQSGIISTVPGNGTSGFSGDGGPAAAAQLVIPRHAAVDSAGNLYIAGADGSRIRKVTAESPPTTANTYHLFPQIADGYFPDGSYYQSSLVVTNSNPGTTTPSCNLQFHGLTIGVLSSLAFTVTSGIYIYTTPGTQSIQTGYASLQCSSNVEAQLLYTSYASTGAKISEATVFSSPSATSLAMVADERNGSQLALAVTNDSSQSGSYTVTIKDSSGNPISYTLSVDPGKSKGAYLDQILKVPANYIGLVNITAQSGTASVIGLRFTGNLFTTIPATILSSTSATAGTYHVFPQIADGYFGDGSYYKSTVIVTNANPSTATACTLQFHGLTIAGQTSVSIPSFTGAAIISTPGTQSIQTGYASLQCSSNVEAQLLYTSYSAANAKLSEATVFSSPSATSLRMVADERNGSQLALAVTNDSSQSGSYTVTIKDSSGNPISYTLSVDPGKSKGAYLDQILKVPANYIGLVNITAQSGTASVIGLRFTGNLFTTIPATIIQ